MPSALHNVSKTLFPVTTGLVLAFRRGLLPLLEPFYLQVRMLTKKTRIEQHPSIAGSTKLSFHWVAAAGKWSRS